MKTVFILIVCCLFFITGINAQDSEKTEILKQSQEIQIDTVKKGTVSPMDQNADVSKQVQPDNTNDIFVRPDKKSRFKSYVKRTIGPIAFLKYGASAGFSTITNSPEEWEKTTGGFTRRFASNIGKGAIKQTTVYALNEALKVDSTYYRSKKKDFGSRMKNALLSTVTARNENGKRVFGTSQIAGTYVSSIISREVWYPKRFNYKDGLRSGTISIGFNALFNIFKEFVRK